MRVLSNPQRLMATALLACASGAACATVCEARSSPQLTPVLELYTSEGCSSCPPADKWLSGLKPLVANGQLVAQAFHVSYWDYIGWVDRFAAPAHTIRQRQLAASNGKRGIYTPQLIRNGQDWRDYASAAGGRLEPARASIALRRSAADAFEATVIPSDGVGPWSAYWSVTEHGHRSRVQAGENAGETLQHDFVVRQYVPVGDYKGTHRLTLRAVQNEPGHPRQVNLVVFDPRTGKPLQALSMECRG